MENYTGLHKVSAMSGLISLYLSPKKLSHKVKAKALAKFNIGVPAL